jgi:hypothetical protein
MSGQRRRKSMDIMRKKGKKTGLRLSYIIQASMFAHNLMMSSLR